LEINLGNKISIITQQNEGFKIKVEQQHNNLSCNKANIEKLELALKTNSEKLTILKESLINKIEQYKDNIKQLNVQNNQQQIKFNQHKIELKDREQKLLNQLNEKENKIYELNLNVSQLQNLDKEKNILKKEKKEIQKQLEEVNSAKLHLREDETNFNELILKEQQKLALLEQKLNEKWINMAENANHLDKVNVYKTSSTKLLTERNKFDEQKNLLSKRENVLAQEKLKLIETETKLQQLQNDFDIQFNIIKRYLVPEDFAFTEALLQVKTHFIFGKYGNPFPCAFLSYAWDPDENKNYELQEWLLKIKRDLQIVGITVFLDIRNMQLNMSETMKTNIEKSDYIFIVCTPRLKERAEESTNPDNINNLQIELNHIKNTNKEIIPLLIEGDLTSSLPSNPINLKNYFAYNFTKASYYKLLIHYEKPKGIIPVLLNGNNNENYIATYAPIVDNFLQVLNRLSSLQSN